MLAAALEAPKYSPRTGAERNAAEEGAFTELSGADDRKTWLDFRENLETRSIMRIALTRSAGGSARRPNREYGSTERLGYALRRGTRLRRGPASSASSRDAFGNRRLPPQAAWYAASEHESGR